jgi:hypothetical protein
MDQVKCPLVNHFRYMGLSVGDRLRLSPMQSPKLKMGCKMLL